MALPATFMEFRKRGDGATFGTEMWVMHLREHDCTYYGIQPTTLYTKRIWKHLHIPVTTQHAAQVRKKKTAFDDTKLAIGSEKKPSLKR